MEVREDLERLEETVLKLLNIETELRIEERSRLYFNFLSTLTTLTHSRFLLILF